MAGPAVVVPAMVVVVLLGAAVALLLPAEADNNRTTSPGNGLGPKLLPDTEWHCHLGPNWLRGIQLIMWDHNSITVLKSSKDV